MDTTHLPPDFKEFIQLINSAKVEYLLVGGYAVGFHGAPRFTTDIDIWVNSEPSNAAKLGQALAKFGFSEPEIVAGRFLKPHGVFRIGLPPLQIDILTNASGCSFAECYPRRVTMVRDDLEVAVISLNDLRMNKQASGRAKDLADIEGLK